VVGAYSYLTFAQLEGALLQRLQDTAGVFTTSAEAQLYLQEALRVYNAQVQPNTGIVDYVFDFDAGGTWLSINVAGSPRERTVTDAEIQTQMEYMLLEPPTGLTWTGTTQFNITALEQALQFRRDELLQMTGANPVNKILSAPVNSQRTILSDSSIDLRRVRWIPDSSVSSEAPYALGRGDVVSADAYGYALAIQPGAPDSWRVTSSPPLSFDVSCPPNCPGQWDTIQLYAGNALSPPTATILGLPDDWCWVAMYGALADALANSPEATDQLRAKYCLMRYERGMKAMMTLPWLLEASIASLPVDTPSYKEMDAYAQNWENTWPAGDPQIVVGGVDLIALAPFNTGATVSSILTVVGNAQVDSTQPVQLSRDAVEQVLNYAQHVASFKMGGSDFLATMPLLKQFEDYCAAQNRRYAALSIFRPDMLQEGDRSEDTDPRFGPPRKEVKRGA
jgi:hypothetical protein